LQALKHIVELAGTYGYAVSWVDAVIIAERPHLAPYVESMKEKIERSGIPSGLMNIKAKTNEGMGFIGRGEGIAAYVVCFLKKV
jgi:2-C-methyl-D-erythritol 2,4-cyclodiphosphate synthase